MGTRTERLLHPDSSSATTDQEIVDFLNKTFQGFYRADIVSTSTVHPRMVNLLITESESQRALKRNKGAGPGALFAKVLKTLSRYVSPVLSPIIKLFLSTSLIPDDWCCGIVTPVAKAPHTTDPNQFKLISFTPGV